MRLFGWSRPSPAPEPLRLPRGVHFPSLERDAVDVPEALRRQIAEAEQRTQHVQLTTGYVTRASTSPSCTAFIEANVHVDRLWNVVNDLVNALLPIVASPIIGIKDEKPTLGPYTHRERALGVFEPFAEVLAHDGLIEWGLMFGYQGATEEVFVKSAKYLQIWTSDPRGAAKVLRRHGIPEVSSLQFLDSYPIVSETLLDEAGCAGWPRVLEQVSAAFDTLPRVYPP